MDSDLVQRAAASGLPLLECGVCDPKQHMIDRGKINGTTIWVLCRACNGTGKDTSPRGVIAACLLWRGPADESLRRLLVSSEFALCLAWTVNAGGIPHLEHDNTEASLATAMTEAIVAWGATRPEADRSS
jgi:hypothetical protein